MQLLQKDAILLLGWDVLERRQMIRNGVIDAATEFEERRRIVQSTRRFEEAGKRFSAIKARVKETYGVDIEHCRQTYFRAEEKIFAVCEDVLVNTYMDPPVIAKWEEYKQNLGEQ